MPTDSFLARFRAFTLIALELALVLLVVYRFEIEDQKNLLPMLCVAAGGFGVHAWLPRWLRAAFFVLLSLGGLLFILGLANGAAVLCIGLGLIAICHLPVPVLLRAAALLLAGGALAGLRVDYPVPFWPVLASMFMFRVILYLFERRHEKARWPSALTLAYFFPLPNVCFTLFPVLDFQTFRATYYDEDDYAIYQKGVAWIVRGLSHLVAYRLVKYYLLPAPYQLHDLPHVALYLAASYALYLRVSGWFHLITGLLHLFGFNLPRTHDNYFLASSLSDIWRRINIYWKDFMAKVFFFPAFFALRRLGTRAAVVGATLWVFVATWLLHSYQMFWLTGDLPLTRAVALLWLGAGLLVALSLQVDLGRAEQQATKKEDGFDLWAAVKLSLRTLRTFVLVSIFWAFWIDPGTVKLVRLPALDARGVAAGVASMVALVAVVVAVGVLAQWLHARWQRHEWPALWNWLPGGAPLAHIAVLLLLLVVSVPQVAGVFGAESLSHDVATLAEAGQAMHRYYEQNAETRIQAGPFLGKLKGHTAPDYGHYGDAVRVSDDPFLGSELIPGWHGKLAFAATSFNRLGMRDREGITVQKPANTYRLALVGSSIVLGYGVEDGEPFKVPLEERLNADTVPGQPRFEVLNFGTGKSTSLSRLTLLEKKVFDFQPDVLLYFANQDELYFPLQFLPGIAYYQLKSPYPFLDEAIRKSGITADMPADETQRRLLPLCREVTVQLYRVIVADCKRRGVVPVWVYLPMPGIQRTPAQANSVISAAAEAGFVVINLEDWSKGHAPAEVKIGAEDYHPNAYGHRLIAEHLFAELKRRPELLPAAAQVRSRDSQK